MDKNNRQTPQPAAEPDPSTQDIASVSVTSQSVDPQVKLTEKLRPRKILIIVFSVIGALVLIGIILFIISIAFISYSLNSQCGVKSATYKQEVPKVAVLNSVTVLGGQPNKPTSIYDSSAGECNLDVAQSYSATKSYNVSMDGATALSTVTENLKKQGFRLSKQIFTYGDVDGLGNCSASMWGWANYIGKSTTITVVFGSPTQQCPDPPDVYLLSTLPSVTQAQFSTTPITSIKATVSTPDATF